MRHLAALALAALVAVPAGAEEPPRARPAAPALVSDRSAVTEGWRGAEIALGLTAPVAFRTAFLDAPPRLVIDLAGAEHEGFAPGVLVSRRVSAARIGENALRPGWTRLVLTLDGPHALASAGIEGSAGDAPVLRIALAPTCAERFAAFAAPEGPEAVRLPPSRRRQTGERPLVVVLDPGHGGIDPGAERGATNEAALMLAFARDLRRALESFGRFRVVMTRDSDAFVPLETRVAIAHGAQADAFLSLHADALAEGQATGATVYTLSERASDAASAALAERHERDGMLAGVDLTGQDDEVGRVLIDLARVETAPRAARLADRIVAAMAEKAGPLYKTPRREAGFAVLKSPEVPSVLIELGYLSNAGDFARISDPGWRAQTAAAIAQGLARWADEDAAEARLLRR